MPYQYDAAGNTIHNGQFAFVYNQANRLSLAQAGSVTAGYYVYNGLGQRVLKAVGNTARLYFYDLNGQLISEIDLARNTHLEYVYLEGRPLAQLAPRSDLWDPVLWHVLPDAQDPNQSATVTVDIEDQTIEVQLSSGPSQTYVMPHTWELINYADQRYLNAADPQTGATTGFAMDYSLHLYDDELQAVLHLTPKDGSPERYFVLQGPTDSEPPVRYYHTDHLGTPRALTDPAQQIVWWAEYEPFGKANITTELVTNNLRFPGQYFDAETGLHYNYFRDYDPVTGRYIESDPIGLKGGINTYSYALNNPLMYIDPEGLAERGGGQKGIGGDDPLIPRDINKNTPRDQVKNAIERIEGEIKKNPNMNPARKRALKAWIKVAKRGFTKSICPPLFEDLVKNVLMESCMQGDMISCQTYGVLYPDEISDEKI